MSGRGNAIGRLAIDGGTPVRARPYPRWPEIDAGDEAAVLEVVRSGRWWMYAYGEGELAGAAGGGSSRVEAAELAFARAQGVPHAVAVSSGSGALEIACRALGLGPGDEVITTPYTFIASSSCILNALALPVFVDIDPETYNLDPARVEAAITPRTRAILPVHFGGSIADMTRLREIARRRGLKIIEDSAQAHGARLVGNRPAGALGDIGVFSLQQSKLLTCGEGGFVTTADPGLAELAWSLRHYGRTPRGLWYEHARLGWHYRMTELQGALLLSQLEKMPEQLRRRERNARALGVALRGIPGIRPCLRNPETEADAYYLFILRYDADAWDGLPRAAVLAALNAEGIPAGGGYSFPIYENPLFRTHDFNGPRSPYRLGREAPIDFGRYRGACPAAERACREEAIWLTQETLLGSEDDARDVARAFEKLHAGRGRIPGERP